VSSRSNALVDEKTVDIPSSKYEALSTRLSDVVGLLPTTDPLQGKRCRSELLDIAHELRWFRPPMIRKRPFDAEAEENKTARSSKEGRTSARM
jgi:hypothetical protein